MKRIAGYWFSLILVSILVLAFSSTFQEFIEQSKLIEGTYAGVVIISFFIFWFLMLADFFTNKDIKHPIFVGFSLMFLSWLGALVYFWFVVNKRERT